MLPGLLASGSLGAAATSATRALDLRCLLHFLRSDARITRVTSDVTGGVGLGRKDKAHDVYRWVTNYTMHECGTPKAASDHDILHYGKGKTHILIDGEHARRPLRDEGAMLGACCAGGDAAAPCVACCAAPREPKCKNASIK